MYSISKMLAGTDSADRSQRSRNLFYVSCSRAQHGLAVVFLDDLPEEAEATARAWFASGVGRAFLLEGAPSYLGAWSGFSAPLASAPTLLALLVSAVVEGGQID